MLARILSGTVRGVECIPVGVEVDMAPGLPSISVVGLAQGAVREGRDRVRAALQNSGFPLPPRRITVNLAPADVRKEGSGFDLPLAVGLLQVSGHLPAGATEGVAFAGELGLDGEIRPVRGALALARQCTRDGVRELIVPVANGLEAASSGPELTVFVAATLAQVVDHLRGTAPLPEALEVQGGGCPAGSESGGDLADVRGHAPVKRALEVAAAGSHNMLLLGPPGGGKTMLARRIGGILPPMDREEALEATTIHSVAGLLPEGAGLLAARPFRAPHHTISSAGMSGGGTPIRPGEMTLAHNGVLFLDELPEFSRGVLETLRQPLESGWISVARARERVRFPARFTLAAAMNPCPCGHLGDPRRPCTCDPTRVERYRSRISGPLRDRIDLHLEVAPVPFEDLRGAEAGEASSVVRERVIDARQRQAKRFQGDRRVRTNSDITPALFSRYAPVESGAEDLLRGASRHLGLSTRAVHRIVKVARTVADLDGCDRIERSHVAEAVHYRILDRPLVGID